MSPGVGHDPTAQCGMMDVRKDGVAAATTNIPTKPNGLHIISCAEQLDNSKRGL